MLTTLDLCKNIEEVAGWKMTPPRDFDKLSDIIFVHVHERVSPTTLKRLWGYVDEDVKPRRYTLDALSKFLGYTSFDEYCNQAGEPQSGFVQSVSLKVEDLKAGNCIDLRWAPDRQCLIRYLGDARFAIDEAVNTKLHVGDTFTCHLFLKHEPLMLSCLVHDGNPPVNYVAGKIDGVNWTLRA